MNNPWFGRWMPGEQAAFRLFCLPYAGGATAAYREWHTLAPEHIQICPLELPGRGSRFGEPPVSRLRPLVDGLAGAVGPFLDRPFAIFGHSMGGLLAFELTRALRRRGAPLPAHLFVSGRSAPDAPPEFPPLGDAPDERVLERLRELGGTPQEILEEPELMALMLPTLRADFAVLESYDYRDEPPLPVPLTVFGGTADARVTPARLPGWRRQTSTGSRLRMLPGGHFFLHTATPEILNHITHALPTPHPETAAS
ncbi:alpha/beta fold hydrolase [Streptomyces cinnabarinus]|uniref:Alpha/beta fold hydrolase n=1 Tax=Streptomyces cinnabarinus TaxID=67287 RepID=A0ABY7KNK4_9ACTN|nr:alpha/beta fold hydrolase [Streptomyces cinnabarinus]WAZ26173.1 alpha/beta fold hydrolase [Streptomyces cinnabarinus]